MPLPIESILPELGAAIASSGAAVLQAPPGAGKTTRVPLFLLETKAFEGRLILLEPRRVAARTAATRMAETLGQKPGETVGYRFRGETKVSRATRIEVVTEGVLTRMLQNDPSLEGIGAILFDEFHERSLNADLGLALTLEAREALRPNLKLIVMSATLDAAPVAALVGDAPVITSQGRAYPVTTHWAARPEKRTERGWLERAMAARITEAHEAEEGSILAFLPGAGEIARTQNLLDVPGTEILPLYGALPFAEQLRALSKPDGRRIVLATAIAETSLTVPGVRVVVDAGLARRARFDPASGMTRLVTERAARAEAEQRQGRAGREAPGACYRLWTKAEEGVMPAFAPVEMETGDLSGLALDLAAWGAEDPADLAFLTPPPEGALSEARELLGALGALGKTGLTDKGQAMAALPLSPRLAAMVVEARAHGMGGTAAELAALLEDGPTRQIDIARALAEVRRGKDARAARIRREAKRTARQDTAEASPGAVLSFAYPDRIAQRRTGDAPRYLMSGGGGAALPLGEELGAEPWLVAADLDGDRREARIRAAAAVSEEDVLRFHTDSLVSEDVVRWDGKAGKVVSETQDRLGAIVLRRRPAEASDAAIRAAMVEGIAEAGLERLSWSAAAKQLCARVKWAGMDDWPDLSVEGLTKNLDWLAPFIQGRTKADWDRIDLLAALEARLGWEAKSQLDSLAPTHLTAPTGTRLRVDYSGAAPAISVRLQEMLGQTRHPTIGAQRIPVVITLLSPAQRPIQVTSDLPGFWQTSYPEVRKEMRSRYIRHHWPEDPAEAAPMTRSIKRKR